jgi:selenocysteine lyase/cysteine desulfurase
MIDLEKVRQDTPGCEKLIHFNNAGAALMPSQVVKTIQNYLAVEEYQGGYETADRYADELGDFYGYAARLLNCQPRNIAFTTNATDSYNRALSAIDFKPGDVILLTDNDYPSNYIACISLQKRLGLRLVTIRNTPSGEVDLNDLDEKLKKYAPRLVSISHVPTSSGLVQPAVKIGEIIKKYDTLYLLDACQSLGQMEVDAIATHADFISGTFRKFLRGPRGAGILYVSEKALAAGMEPLFIDLRGAAWVTADQYISVKDARRFEDWETSYALMMGCKEALKYLLTIGINNIEARNAELTGKLKNELGKIDKIRLLDRGAQQCSIVTFSTDGMKEETMQFYHAHSINIYTSAKSSAIIDFQNKGIDWAVRVSPHYYNTESEISRFVEVTRMRSSRISA